MNQIVCLLRGINVGGNHLIKMSELVSILEGVGLADVWTYIQSGNVVAKTEARDLVRLSQQIGESIQEAKGFLPKVICYTADDYRDCILNSPFGGSNYDESKQHFFFLERRAAFADGDLLEELKTETEQIQLTDTMLYLYAPDGIGRSKLVAKVDRVLGVNTTARNYRTVTKLMDYLRETVG